MRLPGQGARRPFRALSPCQNAQLTASCRFPSRTHMRVARDAYSDTWAKSGLDVANPYLLYYNCVSCFPWYLSPRSDGEGTSTPAQIQVIALIPWRFGTTSQEFCAIFIYVRINAFISRALFPTPVCVRKIGGPVVGYCEPTNGVAKSALLVSRGPTAVDNILIFYCCHPSGELDTWMRVSPTTYPTHWEIHQDAMYPMAQLHAANFHYLPVPRRNYGVFGAPRLPSALTLPSNPSPLSASQLAAQFHARDLLMAADSNSPAPRLRARSPVRETSSVRTPGDGPSNADCSYFGRIPAF